MTVLSFYGNHIHEKTVFILTQGFANGECYVITPFFGLSFVLLSLSVR